MKHIAILIFLFALWLLMSGLFKTLLISAGILSVFLVMVFIHRMAVIDGYTVKFNLKIIKTINYFAWLMVEVIKSNWIVWKILISRSVEINQKFVQVPVRQHSDLAKVIFANSITLTPGTVTIETEDDSFLVHSLNFLKTTESDLKEMNDKVTKIEK